MADFLYRYLTDDGLIDGDKDADGDYSVTPTNFFVQPAGTEVLAIYHMDVAVQGANMQAGNYGSISPLTNGVTFLTNEGAGTSISIRNNADWVSTALFAQLTSFSGGGGSDLLVMRVSFADAGQPLAIRADLGDFFAVRLNDDFTGIVRHTFAVSGLVYANYVEFQWRDNRFEH